MSNSKEFKIVYDNQSHMWTDDNRFNKILVMSQLNYLTDKFKAKGFLFVREIYELLAIPFPKESITAGWYMGKTGMFVVDDILYEKDRIRIRVIAEEDIREYF